MSNVSAFNRGEPTSDDSSCSTADVSACFSCTGSGDDLGLLLQPLRLIVCHERVDQGLQPAIHKLGQLVNGVPDAVVSDAVLREVIGANLLAAVTRSHHRLALLGKGLLLLLLFHLVKAGA